ncbi:MAG: hypothetical protein ACR2JW_04550 [Thermomicrobiales bacterium]
MAEQQRMATNRAHRKGTSVSVPEIAATLQVPETVVRSYLATQTFRGVRLTFSERQEPRRRARQWRQRPLKGM